MTGKEFGLVNTGALKKPLCFKRLQLQDAKEIAVDHVEIQFFDNDKKMTDRYLFPSIIKAYPETFSAKMMWRDPLNVGKKLSVFKWEMEEVDTRMSFAVLHMALGLLAERQEE